MEGYTVTIKETSKDLTARERLMMKDRSNATPLDSAVTVETPLVITPDSYAVLSIHNESSDNPDYEKYMIVDKNGQKYITGSVNFWNSFKSIWDEMSKENEEFQIEVYKLESKNYKGKQFLTCSII